MKKNLVLSIFIGVFMVNSTYAKNYIKVEYSPLTQEECLSLRKKLGLKYCPYDNDHLAGAARACGHINKLPSRDNLQELAQKLYGKHTKLFIGR